LELDVMGGVLCSPNYQSSGECHGSGLITTYCLELDAEHAQELENFLDDARHNLDILGWLEAIGGGLGLLSRAFPNNLPIAVIEILSVLPLPISAGLFILGIASQMLSGELDAISENLSDSGVTQTGGTLVVSSNILYDRYDVITPNGEIYSSIGRIQIPPGIHSSQEIIRVWALLNGAK
jgi:hypothetical protein